MAFLRITKFLSNWNKQEDLKKNDNYKMWYKNVDLKLKFLNLLLKVQYGHTFWKLILNN